MNRSLSLPRPAGAWATLPFWLSLSLILTLLSPLPAWTQPGTPATAPDTSLLQFKSGNHILAFTPQRVNLVSLDHALHIEFAGARSVTPISSTPAASHGAAARFEEVSYAQLWPGIDAVFAVQAGAVAKSTYRVAPGADPAQIRLVYNNPPKLQTDGSLRFDYPGGQMFESPPLAWQDIGSQRAEVSVRFVIDAQGWVSFSLGAYHPGYALIIDPTYRWHTFYGGAPTFELTAFCGYSGSMAYVAGYGTSELFYEIDPLSFSNVHGGEDLFVVVIDAGGYPRKVRFFGSNSNDRANHMVCSENVIYVVGTSAATWTGPDGQAPLFPHSGGNDISVLKLTGSRTTADLTYNWHTFWGSPDNDQGKDILLSDTSLYIIGSSYSSWQGPSSQNPLHPYSGGADLVALKMSTSGGYTWHTFYGSQGDDTASGLSIASNGYIWITATSAATWKGPAAANWPKHAHSGGTDIAVLALSSGGAYAWHTFYGSSSNDAAGGVWVNSVTANGYLVGYSAATWAGDSNTAPLHTHSGGSDIAVIALSDSGAYQWHTFYGGGAADEGKSISGDSSGNLYIAATSFGSWAGPKNEEPLHTYSGLGDIAVLKLSATGAYAWHTFYGSSGQDSANDILINSGPCVAGYSQSAWNGPSGEAPKQDFHNSLQAGALLKLNTAGAYFEHMFIDAQNDDFAAGLAIDAENNFILVGTSKTPWRGPANQAPLHAHSGGTSDILILKLSPTGSYLWHTFYGSATTREDAADVATDASSNIYITGDSRGTWNGPGSTPPLDPYWDSTDIYILKLNSAGAYQWHTFFGGSLIDESKGLTVTSTGGVYVTGLSSSAWSGPSSAAPRHAFSSGKDVVVIALETGGAYRWHTFYGADGDNAGIGIVEKNAYIYVTGYGGAWTAPNAPLHAHDGSESNLFVLKLNDTGAYNWHTFYGGPAYGADIVTDASSNLYIAASNRYNWNGPTGQLPLHPWSEYAMVVLKLNSGGGYVWHGFFGDANSAMSPRLALDPSGNIWISMEALHSWSAYNSIPPLRSFNGARDVCLLQLTPTGRYRHHTYIGSADTDQSGGLAVTSTGLVAVSGSSFKTWNSPSNTPPLHAFNAGSEIFLATFIPVRDHFVPIINR